MRANHFRGGRHAHATPHDDVDLGIFALAGAATAASAEGSSVVAAAAPAHAVDQTRPGAGNAAAVTLAARSPLVQSAQRALERHTADIRDHQLRHATRDAIGNRDTCIAHRAGLGDADKDAIVAALVEAKLLVSADGACHRWWRARRRLSAGPRRRWRLPAVATALLVGPRVELWRPPLLPGRAADSRDVQPRSSRQLADGYRQVYGHLRADGLPEVEGSAGWLERSDLDLAEDLVIAAPLWHDWAKPIVFQWNADGSEFSELNFGGSGTNDAWGAPEIRAPARTTSWASPRR